jgi:hypothetical protein
MKTTDKEFLDTLDELVSLSPNPAHYKELLTKELATGNRASVDAILNEMASKMNLTV